MTQKELLKEDKKMKYPEFPNYDEAINLMKCYAQLKCEYGSNKEDIENIINSVNEKLESVIKEIKQLSIDEELIKIEPNHLKEIKMQRPNGPRKLWNKFNKDIYKDKLEGALLGRLAGCTLGAPVEFWSIDKMKLLAKENNMDFPPKDYWLYVPDPYQKRYEHSLREAYTRKKMNGVPVDDDIVYTILGLLIVEDFGLDFTIDNVGKAWIKYLPYACTAEKIALKNLKKSLNAYQSGEFNNPFCEWIGAFIRSDSWGYISPGWPEKAAEMAYRDAYISHRRQGIYGEMFFSATISAAFEKNDLYEVIQIGLSEIPKNSSLSKAINWTLEISPKINNYQQARDIIDEKFKGMNRLHTINNACLTILGLLIGKNDFTKVIGETVAMGLDNDCTAATAGSIIGAIIGKKGIPEYWYKNFNDKIYTYINELPNISISDLVNRFYKKAEALYDL